MNNSPLLAMQLERTWAVEPPRTAKSIFHKNTRAGTFHRPTTAPEFTRFDPVPGLPNLVQGVPASPRGKRLVPNAHRMPNIPVRGATAAGPWAECIVSPRKAAWPRHGTENSLMFRNPMERRAAHEGTQILVRAMGFTRDTDLENLDRPQVATSQLGRRCLSLCVARAQWAEWDHPRDYAGHQRVAQSTRDDPIGRRGR
eukprot:s184_g16.t1